MARTLFKTIHQQNHHKIHLSQESKLTTLITVITGNDSFSQYYNFYMLRIVKYTLSFLFKMIALLTKLDDLHAG